MTVTSWIPNNERCGSASYDADPNPACHFDADPNAGPDPAIHFDAEPDPDTDPSFQIKAQNFEKVLKLTHIQYILACHLDIGADPDPAHHFDADAYTDPACHSDK